MRRDDGSGNPLGVERIARGAHGAHDIGLAQRHAQAAPLGRGRQGLAAHGGGEHPVTLGRAQPVGEGVLAAQRRALPGEVIGVELDRDDGRWVYELKILTPNGDRRELELDARDLTILDID